ncbi:MAG: thioredoxin domain-containing protein [Anaerolineae bacterium]|nr:thioredoxin domain-containing protein [Anaerolineae bacterium]
MKRLLFLVMIGLVLVASQIVPSYPLAARHAPDQPSDSTALIAQDDDAVIPGDIEERYAALVKRGYMTGRTPDGLPALGSPYAPFTMEQVSSFSCTHCATFTANYFNNLLDKVLEGKLRYVFIPLTEIGSFDSTRMAQAALCAGEQGKFWQMHDVMFDWLDRYGEDANDLKKLTSAASQLGLNVTKFSACMGTKSRVRTLLAKAEAIAADRDVTSTPRAYLNGEQIFPREDGLPALSLDDLRDQIDGQASAK